MTQLYSNNATATLLAGITNVATSFTISSGSEVLFPVITLPGDYFIVTLEADGLFEIVKITATASNIFTGVRGQEGTTARAWNANTKVELRLTAGGIQQIQSDIGSGGVVNLGLGSTVDSNLIWHAGNDGTGSGLDADMLDGLHASAFATLSSPAFTGNPTAPTAAVNDNDTSIATTAYVIGQKTATTPIMDGTAAIGSETRWAAGNHIHPTDTSRAALLSPTFTGTPAGPTAAADTNTTQLATTAFVVGQKGIAVPLMNGSATAGSSLRYSSQDHVHPTDTSKLDASAYTAADVLSKLLTVDGTGSGVDADLLDGQHGSAYALLAGANFSGTLQQGGSNVLVNGGALGTPSSGTLTNCTLPASGLTGVLGVAQGGTGTTTSTGTGSVVLSAGPTFTGTVTATSITTTVLTASNNGQTSITISTQAGGQQADLNLGTAGINMWSIIKTTTANTGGDVGSDLQVTPRTDAGGSKTAALSIKRSTGNVILGAGPTADNGTDKLQVAGSAIFTGTVKAPAATTALASLSIPHGTAPSSPVNGDLWTTSASIFCRINGVTVDLATGGVEADTLATVTGRGSTTATACTFTNATASSSTGTGAVVITGGLGVGGQVTATTLVGAGSGITSLNMANAASGTLAVARGGTGVTTSTGTGSTVLSASPTFTGTPLAPTATAGTSTTQIATTAYAKTEALQPSTGSVTTTTQVFPSATNAGSAVTALASAVTIENKNGTWVDLQGFVVRLKDNGTARAISFGSEYRAMGVTLPTTTVVNKTMYISMIWNAADTKMDVVSVIKEA